MKYNIHCLLYDLTRGHFKNKLLCKFGYHNYMLKSKIKNIKTIENETPNITIEKNNKQFITYYKCYCCNKKIGLEG